MAESPLIHGFKVMVDHAGVERLVWPTSEDGIPDTAQRQSDEDVAGAIARVKRQLSQRGNQRVLIVPKGQR